MMGKVEGVIFDWAGTTVDFGCFAPVRVFMDIFENAGVPVTADEARKPMGLLKIDHIREMLNMPRIAAAWEDTKGRAWTEEDVHSLYAEFEPALLDSLHRYADPIPGVPETVRTLRERGVKIGSTTGYTDRMMAIVASGAKEKGYEPDAIVTPDDTGAGRPYPYMIHRNMALLGLLDAGAVVKVGDTLSDIREGRHAGVWSVGVVTGSSEMGMSQEEFSELDRPGQEAAIRKTESAFREAGADFTIRTMEALPALIEEIETMLADGKRPGMQKE